MTAQLDEPGSPADEAMGDGEAPAAPVEDMTLAVEDICRAELAAYDAGDYTKAAAFFVRTPKCDREAASDWPTPSTRMTPGPVGAHEGSAARRL